MAEVPFDDDPPEVAEPRPSGRPRRTKKTLADGFLEAIRADFRAHGAGVIAEVRTEKPDQYLKIVLSVLPKDLHLNINRWGDWGLARAKLRAAAPVEM
ncbi:hypothetical protein IQ26_07775 [Mesorhizobium tianshanense]|uniref:Uncharacterized protein n=1 Tax=Mesorhizobium tianshanense TaxID=39844 RepID=A0A562M881_9HYPH|nr:hypothetical protein IQ26_07775 [Mesorhizobium tianshanense]